MAQQRAVLFLRSKIWNARCTTPKDVGVHRLLVEVVGAEASCAHGVLLVELAGDRSPWNAGDLLVSSSVGEPSETFGVRRQAKVLQDHERLVPAHRVAEGRSVAAIAS